MNILELKNNSCPIRIFVSDSSKKSAGFWVSEDVTPLLTSRVSENEEKYVSELRSECVKNNIELIIPMMDFELPVLTKNKSDFAKLGIHIIVSDYETVMNC